MKTAFRFLVFCFVTAIGCGMAHASSTDAMAGYWLPVDFEIAHGYTWLEDTGYRYGCKDSKEVAQKVYHPGSDLNEVGTGGNYEKDHWRVIRAIGNGTVVFVDDSKWASLIIRHDQERARFYSVYGHSRITPRPDPNNPSRDEFTRVFIGSQVVKGQVIGYVWDNATENAHLHFEVRKSSHPDPENGSNWCGFLGGKTQDQIKAGYVDPEAFAKSDGYSAGTCAPMSGTFTAGKQGSWVFCWMDPAGQSNVACEYATAHKLYQKLSDGRLSAQWTFGSDALRYHCQSRAAGAVDIVAFLTNSSYFPPNSGGSDPGGGPITPPPSSEPRNDLVPHVNAYRTTGDKRQVTADSLTGPTLPIMEGEVLKVEQIMDSKDSDVSKWFREQFNSIYTTVWYKIVTADKTTVAVPWTELFTRKFDPGKLEKGESYGESTTFTVPVGYPNHYLVLASCADPTDRVLEKNESTTRRSPARNPTECGTNNVTRIEELWINPKPRSVDYVIQSAGMINAPDYFWIGKPYRVWYEGVNLGPDASIDRIAVSIKIINPDGTRATLLTRTIEPANLTPNAVYLDQPTDIFTTPTVPGAYWFEFCINADGKPETNRNNNCFLYRKEVRDPNISLTNGAYRCPVIRSETWAAWSNQPYSPPFTSEGKLFFTPWCLDNTPSYVEIFVSGSSTVWVHHTIRAKNQVTGAETSHTALCSETKSGEWCPGVATVFTGGASVDTSVTGKPMLIRAYVCIWDGVAWKCASVQQAATQAARQ